MAIYHLSTKPISRSSGRTATASIAYRAGIAITDERTGKQHDYTKRGVDVAIHQPDKHGDNCNHHAHIMLTTRKLERLESGKVVLTSKSQLEMSNTQLKERGLPSAKEELKAIRKQWADMTNERLERAEIDARIDHRSHKDRGLIFKPTKKTRLGSVSP